MPKTSTAPSLRDRLSKKCHPTATYLVLLDDPAEPAAALAAARQEVRLVKAAGQEPTPELLVTVEEAEARVAACWQPIVVRSIPAEQLTALVAEHPPTKEQKTEAAQWNPETFQPALIAACAQDAGMTAEQWAHELTSGRWSTAERNELFGKCLEVNLTTPLQRINSAAAR